MSALSQFDLNLLRLFHAILRSGSVTRAAQELRLSQSAVSAGLARLRHELGDPLFVRQGRGLVPTARALELAPRLDDVIASLEALLASTAPFDPTTCERTFTIASTDAELVVGVPSLLGAMAEALPHAMLRFVSIDVLLQGGGLDNTDIDLAVGLGPAMRPSWSQAPLYDESGCLVVRRDHPGFAKGFEREGFETYRHVDVEIRLGTPGEGGRMARRALESEALQRRVGLAVPSFTAAAIAAASSDLIAGLPTRLAHLLCETLPLRIVEGGPFAAGFMPIAMAWHARNDNEPGHRFFRELVQKAYAKRPPP